MSARNPYDAGVIRFDAAREARARARAKYGEGWLETLVLQMAEEVARLKKKVSDLEGAQNV
jgi:hypothetical protein